MTYPIVAFVVYLLTGVALTALFMFVYEQVTPYREFAEIKAGNVSAAITLGGAIIGFTFPLISAIYFTHSIVEMAKWAVITGVVQLAVFLVMQRAFGFGDCVRKNNVAGATLLAFTSISVGLINAASISY